MEERPATDLCIVPLYQDGAHIELVSVDLKDLVAGFLATEDFSCDAGESVILYNGVAERRVQLLGLGKKEVVTAETLRLSYYKAVSNLKKKNIKEIVVQLPEIDSSFEYTPYFRAIIEGIYFAQYAFLKYRSEPPTCRLKKVNFVGRLPTEWESIFQEVTSVMRYTSLVRDMVNQNADEMTPQSFLSIAQDLVKSNPEVSLRTLEKSELEQEEMRLFLAVAKGSPQEPYLLHLRYNPCPEVHDRTLCIGKAITFDTGGLHLKPIGSMETMRCDMAGGAVALALVFLLAQLRVEVNVDILIPVCENAIGSKSFKPGDIIKSKKGLFVEISSTDAEGRLCLADAITYGIEKLSPKRLIDIATLTGAVEIALGSEISGVLSNSDALFERLEHASHSTHELIARLPLYEGYKELLRSDMADLKNSGGRSGGAILAALFLREFVGNVPWLHLDIAASAFFKEAKRYYGKGATGIGLRLLLNFLLGLSQKEK